ncbi:MAG: DUF58 domain-containing protein [Deltaproteobacteria bacterium]|nr:DUF58 domain-containing protein [Deltaproteobacteria bacterium]
MRPALSVPLPWLAMIIGRAFGKQKQTRRRIFKLPRTLTITKEGWWYIAILLLIGVAAINTGNNLLYLVAATLLSIIIVSGVVSEHTLRRIRITRVMPRSLYKNSPAIVRIEALNDKRRIPSFSFTSKEIPTASLSSEPIYFLKLKPRTSAIRCASYTFTGRGRHTLAGVKLSTRFPFGLFVKGREAPLATEVIVYPDVTDSGKTASLMAREAIGMESNRKRGRGAELRSVREYTALDDARLIYWKAAGRSARLLVKEFEEEHARRFTIVFDNYKTTTPHEFEALVDKAASIAKILIEKGCRVGFRTLAESMKPGAGQAQLHKILHLLALIAPVDGQGANVRVES